MKKAVMQWWKTKQPLFDWKYKQTKQNSKKKTIWMFEKHPNKDNWMEKAVQKSSLFSKEIRIKELSCQVATTTHTNGSSSFFVVFWLCFCHHNGVFWYFHSVYGTILLHNGIGESSRMWWWCALFYGFSCLSYIFILMFLSVIIEFFHIHFMAMCSVYRTDERSRHTQKRVKKPTSQQVLLSL